MLLIYGRKFLCVITLALFCCISLDAATVSVSVSPDGQTVKVKPANAAEEIGINTAEYNVSGTFDPSSLETNEVKPVDPVWNCTCSNVTFVPPVGVQPVPQNPGNPSVSPSSPGSLTYKVSSPNAGQWKLQFKLTVTFDVLDKKTGSKKPNEKFGPYEGVSECTFKSTAGNFKIKLIPDDNFPGHSNSTFGIGESGFIEAWSFDEKIKYSVVSGVSTMPDIVLASTWAFTTYEKVGVATIKINANDNNGNAIGEESITISIIEPSGAYLIFDPNFAGYNHTKGCFDLLYLARYILAPSNVSFSNIKIYEWGEDDTTGVSKYKGDTDQSKNYFAWIGIVESEHNPSSPVGIMSCKYSYEKTKSYGTGALVNVSVESDLTGIVNGEVPVSGPMVGKVTLSIPIRYKIIPVGATSAVYKTLPFSVVSIKEIVKSGDLYIINVSKTGTSMSKEKDSKTETLSPTIVRFL
jgi:hypothetical protein